MQAWAPWVVLVVAVLLAALAVLVAWRLLVWVARAIVRIDEAIFGRRRLPSEVRVSAAASAASAVPVEFTYRDGEGAVTRRSAIIQEVRYEVGRPSSVEAFCLVRRAPRTFKVRSMSDVHDLRTGEIVDDLPRWLVESCA